jgi:hypothetical protein
VSDRPLRDSDRWITPAVVIVGLLVGGGLVALLIATVAWLAARGVDPAPILKTVGALVAGATSLVTLIVQLASRQTVAKTEANTGQLKAAVIDVVQHLNTQAAPPPPGPPSRHAAPPTVPGMGRPRSAGE